MFGFFGNKQTLNTPIPGKNHYGERILMSYVYKQENEGYVLEWVMYGDNNDIENECVNISGYKTIISNSATGENSSINLSTNASQTNEDDRVSDSSIDEIRIGGRNKSRNRTRRRKSRKSGGKRRSKRAKRAIIHHK